MSIRWVWCLIRICVQIMSWSGFQVTRSRDAATPLSRVIWGVLSMRRNPCHSKCGPRTAPVCPKRAQDSCTCAERLPVALGLQRGVSPLGNTHSQRDTSWDDSSHSTRVSPCAWVDVGLSYCCTLLIVHKLLHSYYYIVLIQSYLVVIYYYIFTVQYYTLLYI